jgi:hypothetical protein
MRIGIVAQQLRMGLLTAALALGLSVVFGAASPQPVAAADPDVKVRITGTSIVYSWDTTINWINVTNENAFDVDDVFVEIYDYHLPIDYKDVYVHIGGTYYGSKCRVVDGLGMSSKTRATCDIGRLRAGKFATITIVGKTSVVVGSGTDSLRAKAYTNFPQHSGSDGSDTKAIAWNP